ncbi:MAG: universal stress protein [Burkholderiaceae bacterium]|nr:universal stress protein [Burkholderiaceae bacterium]
MALDKLVTIVNLFSEKPELVLINVQLPLPHPRALAWVGKEVVAEYYGVQSEEELAAARNRLDQGGFAFSVEKRVGDPAHEIVTFADSERCAMIAMGTSGRTALKNLVMGSVATKVLAASKVPVLFLK